MLSDWIIKLAMRHKYDDLGDYMSRYWIVPYSWPLPFAIRVNHIKEPDADAELHDHPWAWRTFILRGWYIEENVSGQRNVYSAGSTRTGSHETFHRIDAVSEGGVWTLFITYRWRHTWGFLVGSPARKVDYREYVSENNRV